MRIGMLVSGGDCPGLNAAIRGAVLRGVDVLGFEMIGFIDGWRGVIEDNWIPLDRRAVRGISPLGGTILGTSRVSPFSDEAGGAEGIKRRMAELELDGLITIGGNGTQTVAMMLSEAGIPVLGLPKTIDNDLDGTDFTFGFDTAVSIATEAIDRLRTTGESHRRCMVLEVMGRDAGWIALHAGMAGGAQVILLPEFPESVEQVCTWVESVRDRGRSPLVVVAEGFRLEGMDSVSTRAGLDGFGRPRLGGIAEVLAPIIEERTGIESRATVLGHVQRGGVPTAFDRVLATRAGIKAADAVQAGEWGTMVSLRGNEMETVPLSDAVDKLKSVPESRYEEVRLLFG
ncbi:ATP-dependent 6-phosphofructokinase [Leucobacter sp. CSA1]|uniref:ATP-dependent 6-phosphofructokinase n=1 Tax=Leucobacter chromiisoli TaxID=2796471 RepID=A0A934UUL7_9MICO|nr:ATP-dependent 6-phosphofructokinase [Leucobacter chromiisoli]MBK0418323.1 ATP-dependent 6-phosphofructokinase [Leucobacter chromiisoli]